MLICTDLIWSYPTETISTLTWISQLTACPSPSHILLTVCHLFPFRSQSDEEETEMGGRHTWTREDPAGTANDRWVKGMYAHWYETCLSCLCLCFCWDHITSSFSASFSCFLSYCFFSWSPNSSSSSSSSFSTAYSFSFSLFLLLFLSHLLLHLLFSPCLHRQRLSDNNRRSMLCTEHKRERKLGCPSSIRNW